MINYASTVVVNRPVEQVYQFVTDVTRYDDWTDMTGTHLVSGGNVAVGAQMATTLKLGPVKQTMVFEVTALEAQRRVGFKTVSQGALAWDSEFTLAPDGPAATRITSAGQIRLNGLLKLLEPLMAGEVQNGEAQELVKFKALVEGER